MIRLSQTIKTFQAQNIGNSNIRLDVFLAEQSGLSRSAVQRLLEQQASDVNGKQQKANYKLSENDTVTLRIPEPDELNIMAEDIPLDILFEDNDIIVVNKPQGMVVHPAAGHYEGTLVNALMSHCGSSLSGINGVLRPGIVHRIDKDTSGILVAAKNDNAHNSLSEQLARHSAKREYLAVVCGGVKQDFGTIDKPIARDPANRKKMAAGIAGGRTAVTHYSVLERLGKYTYIKAVLETGRTHQIRVHMASINRPLLGDTVYGSAKQPFGLNGQVLHAAVLGFVHPSTNRYIEFYSDPPEYFIKILYKLRS